MAKNARLGVRFETADLENFDRQLRDYGYDPAEFLRRFITFVGNADFEALVYLFDYLMPGGKK